MNGTKRIGWIFIALAVFTVGLFAGLDSAYAQGRNQVVVLDASGPVVPPFASYIQRGLEEADELNAEAIILVLDTPGGSVDVTFDIIQDIRTSDVPVIVFVGPRGAKASSAGLLITLAGHASAMAPDTAIGASSPITGQGEDLDTTAQKKAEQYLSAQARSLAERRGDEAVQVAEDAIFEARAVSSNEALEAGLIDWVVEDISELLEILDGQTVEVNGRNRTLNTADAEQVVVPMQQLERALLIFTHPNVVFILLILGVMSIIIEMRAPGGWAAGVIGVTCLGIALYGLSILPVNWLGIAFVIMAFVLFILEVKAATHGALATAGVVSLAAGGIILFNQPAIAPFGRLSIPLVIAQSLLLGAVFAFLVTYALRAQKLPPTTGYEGLIGQTGRVTQALDPVGMVQVWGERWKAVAEDQQTIPAGQEIEVVEASRMRLIVKPTDLQIAKRTSEPG